MGSYELALFGEDSVNYGKFARPGLSIYVEGERATQAIPKR